MDKVFWNQVPEELKAIPQWLTWAWREGKDGLPTKPPIDASTGLPTDKTDPKNWLTFKEAERRSKNCTDGSIAGPGFYLNGNGLVAVDVDNCVNGSTITPWAAGILKRLNSYSEYTPSGNGLRVWVKSSLEITGRKRKRPKHKDDIELYAKGGYCTVTGFHIEGTPTTIEDRDEEIRGLYEEVFGGNGKPLQQKNEPSSCSLSDEEVIKKATTARNGDKFRRLWNGDTSDYVSPSEADEALCCLLAFWVGNDPARINALFRKSGLYRTKWDRHNYAARTIQKAISLTTETYLSSPTGQRGNITEHFRMWLHECYGTFNIEQIYKDLGITNLKEKNLIRVNLSREVERGTIERGQITGTYRKVDQEADRIEILEKAPVPLSVSIPGDVDTFVNIYPGNILINAGSPNAGKTAFDLNFAYDNRNNFEVIYWSSEMESEELTARTLTFGHPQDEWNKIAFWKRTRDFHQVINPNAVNIIDYLEVVEGEFFKVGDNIRKIFEKLDRGIALVSLQMDPGGKFAWGGPKTLDKARLYITLDKGEMTIIKAKNQINSKENGNVNGMVRRFSFENDGSKFVWEGWKRAW
jgi:hypothetical protein